LKPTKKIKFAIHSLLKTTVQFLTNFVKIDTMKIQMRTIIMMVLLPAACFAQNKKPSWQEMKTFHSFMASTFHPAEEGNLDPLKAKADSLLITAQLWNQSAIPSNFKPEETKAELTKLVAQCNIVKEAVAAKKDDKELTKLITQAHDIFHKIVGECRKADE
jgi:hypothetical protein